uniref:SJCHGC09241 protein n=1 Tax=Schistosoma japonicum TaxID=6182 RepID=Q5DD35_SCHJA|nr:SJCHGC09241 protein [Schistosoma japonicum]
MPTVKTGNKGTNFHDIKTRDNTLTSTTTSIPAAQKQEIDDEKVNANKDGKQNADLERRVSNSSGRMGNIRNKFESGEVNNDKKKNKKKSTPKMKYAGVESAKTKFIEEATKATMSKVENGPRKPKEFTPPPDGVAVGILESNPKPRAPDVVTSDDMFEPVDLKEIGEKTKNLRAKFRNMEATGGQSIDEENRKKSSFIDESITVAPEATRSARARWKDIESGKTDKDASSERPKLDIHDGYGGVYENEPEKFENIARAGETKKDLPSGMSARERRELFLKAADTSVVKRDSIKLIDINAAESGIYENEPTRRDNVVRYDDDQTDDYPNNSVKWASEAKSKFIQEASKSQVTTGSSKKILLVENGHTNDDDDGAQKQARYAAQAKQAFLERQKQAEEAAKNKSRPDIIDIWREQCPHSGVFENVPAAHTADVVVTDESEEEEEDDEEE